MAQTHQVIGERSLGRRSPATERALAEVRVLIAHHYPKCKWNIPAKDSHVNLRASNLDRLKQQNEFILSQKVREELFLLLFDETKYHRLTAYAFPGKRIKSLVDVIKTLEKYWLHVLHECSTMDCEDAYNVDGGIPVLRPKCHSEIDRPHRAHLTEFPHLTCFTPDVKSVIKFLLSGAPPEEAAQPKEAALLKEAKSVAILIDPLEKFAHSTLSEWRTRWDPFLVEKNSAIIEQSTLRHYWCGLIDVIFGLWPAHGRAPFHSDGWLHNHHMCRRVNTNPRCLYRGLYFWQDRTRGLDKPISLDNLDASFISGRRGPFKFVKTSRLDEHLTVSKDHEIRVYTNWKRLLMLRVHGVVSESYRRRKVQEDQSHDNATMFQELALCRYHTDKELEGSWIQMFSEELVHTYVVLFFREARKQEPKFGTWGWWRQKLVPTRSEKIAEAILKEITLEEIAQFSEAWGFDIKSSVYSSDFNRLWRGRLEDLHDIIVSWRPHNLRELFYMGFGELSPLEWYAFIFSLGFGIATILSVVLVGIQTF